MRTLMKNNDKFGNREKEQDRSHVIVSGHPVDTLDSEEMDLYRFMLGGLQAK